MFRLLSMVHREQVRSLVSFTSLVGQVPDCLVTELVGAAQLHHEAQNDVLRNRE